MERYPTLPELVHKRMSETPDVTALTAAEGGSVTWRELYEASHKWADWLRGYGVQPEDRVVTIIPQSLESNFAWLGIAATGGVEVSINANFRGEWLRHALETSTAKVVIVAARHLDQVLGALERTRVETILVYDGKGAQPAVPGVKVVAEDPEARPFIRPQKDHFPNRWDIACVLYTSGTTGASKAVQLPWQQLSLSMAVDYFGKGRQVFYLPYAPYHLSGRCALFRGALFNGHTVVREVFSTSEFWSDVRKFGCTWTILYSAPTRFLMAQPERPDDADNPLEWVLQCPILPEVDRLKERFGLKAYSVYGMTEICSPIGVPPEYTDTAHVGCCGRPIEGVEARLVDANDYEVADGEVGELTVRSSEPWCFTIGYQQAPEATAKAWRNGWFHTGDMMRKGPDGLLYYVDRSKDMIRRRGENISSVELEAELLRHPDVQEAAALGLPSELGDEDVMVVVIAKPGVAFDPARLVKDLEDRVPRYALPRYIRTVEDFPRTQATQRIEKHKLRAEGVTADTWERK
ncbi:MAG: AMP-binding protein [Flavobacteriaceae bacterium]